MAATLGSDARCTSEPQSPRFKGEVETSILRLFQHQLAIALRPFVDHVDELFKAVESLGSDLTEEHARSMRKHDETRRRLDNLDKTVSLYRAEFAEIGSALEARLNMGLSNMEAGPEEQHSHNAAAVGDASSEACCKYPSQPAEIEGPLAMVFEQHEQMRHHLCRVEERLDVVASTSQSAIDALRQELRSNTEQLGACIGDAGSHADVLQNERRAAADRFSGFDGQLRELLAYVNSVRDFASGFPPMLGQHQDMVRKLLGNFDSRLCTVEAGAQGNASSLQEHMFAMSAQIEQKLEHAMELALRQVCEQTSWQVTGMNQRLTDAVAETKACTCSLRAEFKHAVDALQYDLSGRLTMFNTKLTQQLEPTIDAHHEELKRHLTRVVDRLEPALEEQQQQIGVLQSMKLDKINQLESKLNDGVAFVENLWERIEELSQAIWNASSGLATNGHCADQLDAVPEKNFPDLSISNLAAAAVTVSAAVAAATFETHHEKADGSRHPCRLHQLDSSPSTTRTVTSSGDSELSSRLAEATNEVTKQLQFLEDAYI